MCLVLYVAPTELKRMFGRVSINISFLRNSICNIRFSKPPQERLDAKLTLMCMSEYAYGILNWLGNRTYRDESR